MFPEHDLILHGGNVITLDGGSRIAASVAVSAGRISAVGAAEDVLDGRGRTTRVIDLAGRTACPGFIDTHAHMDREGLKARGGYSLAGRHSVAAIVDAVAAAAARTPAGEWVVFMPMGTPKSAISAAPTSSPRAASRRATTSMPSRPTIRSISACPGAGGSTDRS